LCARGISANMQSWFNGILIPFSASLSIGNNMLPNILLGYLTSITSPVQDQINNILRYQSGQILQTKIFSNSRNSIVTQANGTSIDLLNVNFTPKSLSSQILVSFDAQWSVNGTGNDRNNKVVALHLASLNEGRELLYTKKKRTVEDLEELMTDESDVHRSIREGLVLALVPDIQNFITHNILKNVDLDGTDV
jgi:hypothetical protein